MREIYASRNRIQAAITETVKVITNMTDIGVTLTDGTYTTDTYVATKEPSRFNLYLTLRESKSLHALWLLRDSTDDDDNKLKKKVFSRTMSKKLFEPLFYAAIFSWQLYEITQPPTSRPSSPSSKPTSSPSSPPSSPLTSSKSKIISLISEHLQSS